MEVMDLITANEIIEIAPVKNDFSTKWICENLDLVLLSIFDDNCIKVETLDSLIADAIDRTFAMTFQSGVSYQEDDLVYANCGFYKSLIDNNTDLVTVVTSWEKLKRFNKECYNKLWDLYLKKLIALTAVYKAMPYATYQASNKGLSKFSTDASGAETVSEREFTRWEERLKQDITVLKERVIKYLNENTICFPEYAQQENTCGKEKNCQTRYKGRFIL